MFCCEVFVFYVEFFKGFYWRGNFLAHCELLAFFKSLYTFSCWCFKLLHQSGSIWLFLFLTDFGTFGCFPYFKIIQNVKIVGTGRLRKLIFLRTSWVLPLHFFFKDVLEEVTNKFRIVFFLYFFIFEPI